MLIKMEVLPHSSSQVTSSRLQQSETKFLTCFGSSFFSRKILLDMMDVSSNIQMKVVMYAYRCQLLHSVITPMENVLKELIKL